MRKLAAISVCLVLALAAGCQPQFDPEINAATAHGDVPLRHTSDTTPLACFTAVAGALQIDSIPKWRTELPLAPLAMQPVFGKPWSSSSTISIRGDEIAVVDEGRGQVVFLHRPTLTKQRAVVVGERPAHLLHAPNADVWASVRGAGSVARIRAGAVTAKLWKVGTAPVGLAMSNTGSRLYVALSGEGRIAVIDAKTGASIPELTFTTPGRPRAVASTNLGGSPEVERIVAAMLHGAAFVRHVKYVPGLPAFDNRTAPLRKANPAHLAAGDAFELPAWRALSAAVHPQTGDVLVPHVLVFTGDDVVAPASTEAAQTSYSSEAGTRCSSTPLRPVEVTVSAIAHTTGKAQPTRAVRDPYTRRQLLARFDQPTAIAHHRFATLALVTAAGTSNVLVLNTALPDPMAAPLGEIEVQPHPDGVAFSSDGTKAYVRDNYGTNVSEVDLLGLLHAVTEAWLQDENGRPSGPRIAPRFIAADRATRFTDDVLNSRMRRGRSIFHTSRNPATSVAGRFACASCHFEGGDDKQVWHAGDGPRQTPSLAGRLNGTGPFNWKGTESNLRGNMRETIKRMGGHGLSTTDERALELFLLDGLKAPMNPHRGAALTPAQLRGRDIFFSPEVGCASCHVPPTFTDGKQHQIGTVDGADGDSNTATHCSPGAAETLVEEDAFFDTPSLLGLHATAPYLHDGSAASLFDVLERTAGTMGNTAHLDGKQRADLVAFLLTL